MTSALLARPKQFSFQSGAELKRRERPFKLKGSETDRRDEYGRLEVNCAERATSEAASSSKAAEEAGGGERDTGCCAVLLPLRSATSRCTSESCCVSEARLRGDQLLSDRQARPALWPRPQAGRPLALEPGDASLHSGREQPSRERSRWRMQSSNAIAKLLK